MGYSQTATCTQSGFVCNYQSNFFSLPFNFFLSMFCLTKLLCCSYRVVFFFLPSLQFIVICCFYIMVESLTHRRNLKNKGPSSEKMKVNKKVKQGGHFRPCCLKLCVFLPSLVMLLSILEPHASSDSNTRGLAHGF